MEDTKDKIKSSLSHGDFQRGYQLILQLIKTNSTYSNYVFAERYCTAIAQNLNFRKLKVAILSSITIEPIISILHVKCCEQKINAEFFLGDYNIIDQYILDYDGELYRFKPDVLIIFLRAEERCPKLLNHYIELSKNEIEIQIQETIKEINNLLMIFKEKSNAKVILHNFEYPAYPVFGVYDSQILNGQKDNFEKLNHQLIEISHNFKDCFILDYELLISKYGKNNWFDSKLWYTSKGPISRIGFEALSNYYIRYFIPILGLTKKCIVVDLDNTLWGGIIGEDGIDGIIIGDSPKGSAYLDFQVELKKLYHKGIILAINSKNNQSDVMEVFEKKQNMKLKKENFACIKINWDDKAKNMFAISNELNIGLDSFVFFDDSPIERELIKQKIPDIKVIDIPENPFNYAQILRDLPDFEIISISEEDLKRGEMYYAQCQRKQLGESCGSLEDFYKSLQMKVKIFEDDNNVISRISQLTQKTNQFNLTTRRYSENEIANFITSSDYHVYSLSLFDKFGDNGLVGVVIVSNKNAHEWIIDEFLLSCRVIGRTVETAFFSYLIEKAKKSGIRKIIGEYIPTKKNACVRDLYKSYNFKFVKEENNITTWELFMTEAFIEFPEWISLINKNGD